MRSRHDICMDKLTLKRRLVRYKLSRNESWRNKKVKNLIKEEMRGSGCLAGYRKMFFQWQKGELLNIRGICYWLDDKTISYMVYRTLPDQLFSIFLHVFTLIIVVVQDDEWRLTFRESMKYLRKKLKLHQRITNELSLIVQEEIEMFIHERKGKLSGENCQWNENISAIFVVNKKGSIVEVLDLPAADFDYLLATEVFFIDIGNGWPRLWTWHPVGLAAKYTWEVPFRRQVSFHCPFTI